MYIFLNRSFIDKISVFPIYFLIKIFHDTCQTLATGDTYAVFVTSRVRTETRASSASVYVSSVLWRLIKVPPIEIKLDFSSKWFFHLYLFRFCPIVG